MQGSVARVQAFTPELAAISQNRSCLLSLCTYVIQDTLGVLGVCGLGLRGQVLTSGCSVQGLWCAAQGLEVPEA